MEKMNQENLNKIYKEHSFKYNKHLTPELDITSLVLKSHLFLEEILHEIILLQCKNPKALDSIQFSFHHKLKLAEALHGAHFYNFEIPFRIWPVLDALNKLRNELAHRIDSSKLDEKIVKFLRTYDDNFAETKELSSINEILKKPELLKARVRYILNYMLGCLGFIHGLIYLNPPEKLLASLFEEINIKTCAERIIIPNEIK